MYIPDSFFTNILSRLQQEAASHRAFSAQLKDALDDLLTRLPPPPDSSPDCRLLFLRGMEADAGAVRQTVRMLAHSRLPLDLQIRNSSSGPEFLLGTTADREQTLLTLLQAGLPGLQTAPEQHDDALPLQTSALFSCLDQDSIQEGSESWMDALSGLSLPGCWSVRVEAVPVDPDDSWIREQLESMEVLSSKLTALSQMTSTISQPLPTDPGTQSSLWQRSADPGHFTASVQRQTPQADRSLCRVQNALDNLDSLLRHGGWKIRITLGSGTRQQMEILQSFFHGAFSGPGALIRWKEGETSDCWSVLTRPQFAALVSLPTSCSSGYPVAIPPAQLRRPFGIFGQDSQASADALHYALSGREDLCLLMLDPDGGYCRNIVNRVFRMIPGDSTSLRINPFWLPESSDLTWHIQSLTDLIGTALQFDALHRAVLEQTITSCYTELGWDLITNTNYYSHILEDERLYPTFDQLMEALTALSENLNQDILVRLERFVTGACGTLLNRSCATPLKELLSVGQDAAVDFSGLVSPTVKQVAMGALLIQLAQAPQAGTHLLTVMEADMVWGREGECSMMEDVLHRLTAMQAGPVFTARSPEGLSRCLLDAMDGCIVHRLSVREKGEDLVRFLRPGQGSPELQALDPSCAMLRFGSMDRALSFRLPPSPSRDKNPGSDRPSSAQPRELIRHLLDASADLMQLTNELMEPLYFQILFDQDRVNLTAALRENLFGPIRRALTHHTLMDMLRDTDPETLIPELVEQRFRIYIRRQANLGYCLQNLMEMYVSRILRLAIGERPLREADWKVLQDYRRTVLEPRYRDMVLRSRGNLHELICRSAGAMTHSELLVQLLVELYRYYPQGCGMKELSDFVHSTGQRFLLKLPGEEQVRSGLTEPMFLCIQEDES